MKIVTEENLTSWRRYLHENSELSLQEYNTKKYLKNILDSYGVEYEEVIETGLIVTFRASTVTKDAVIFRADMDALPIAEENNIEFKSKNDGVMHACGHDGHTTMLLGAVIEAKNYYENNNTKVNSIFVFQPAEESIGGGKMIVDSYKFTEKYNILASYALHMNPDYPESTIISKNNEIMASANEFRIYIDGKAAHVGLKYLGIDALNIATNIYQEVLKINSLYTKARNTNIIHIGKMYGGDAMNIVAGSAYLEGTIRTYSKDDLKIIKEKINNLAQGYELITGAKIKVKFEDGLEAVINNTVPYEIIRKVVANENINYIELEEAYLYGEDFSAFSHVGDINFSFLGLRNEEKGFVSGLHTPTFNFDEKILKTGVKYYLGLIKYYNE